MAATRVATIRGTAIVPGVSKNGRLYTKELLAGAVQRAQERIASGTPLTMLTHHGAEDDSTRIVGRITKLRQDETGAVKFEADLADTAHGRDIAALVTGDQPYLDGVSIRGWWLGETRDVDHDGQRVTTGDDLELDGLDFTKTPGVDGARIAAEAAAAAAESAHRVPVYESVSTATAEASKTPYGDVQYADPGYQDDKVRRYPLDTAKHVRAAWSYINQATNAGQYTAAQLKRIKGRIKAAAKKLGIQISDTEAFMPEPIGETTIGTVREFYAEPNGPAGQGGFCIDLCNGPVSITLRAYSLDPADLPEIGSAAMDGAIAALRALDPDLDADIDVPGAGAEDTDGDTSEADDNQMETAPAARRPATETTPQTAGETTTETESAVSETDNKAAETAAPTSIETTTPAAPMVALTTEQFQQLLAAHSATPAAEAAATPAEQPVEETEDQRVARLVKAGVEEGLGKLRDELAGELRRLGPPRRGFVKNTTETAIPEDKRFVDLPKSQRDAMEQDGLLKHFGFAE